MLAVALLSAEAAGCQPPRPPRAGGTRVVTDGTPPRFPGDFAASASMGPPPAPDPSSFALAYLEQLYPPMLAGWTAFLEDCRLRLPPDAALNRGDLAAVLSITLGRHGEMLDLVVAQSSGNADFDAVAREVVQEGAPFPAPPPEAISDDDFTYVSWQFARDQRQAGVATASVKRIEWPLERAIPKLLESGDLTGAARRLAAKVPPDASVEALAAGGASDEADKMLGLGERIFGAAVREALLSSDAEVQRVAVAAAGQARVTAAAHELRGIADGALDVELRGSAIAALGAIGDTGAAPMLLAMLERDEGGNADISAAAAQALAQLGHADEVSEVVRRWLASEAKPQRWAALVVMARFAAPGALPTLAALISGQGADPGGKPERDVRVAACVAVGVAAAVAADRSAALKALQVGLDDHDAAVRAACAAGLARAGEGGAHSRLAFWKLTPLFKHKDDRVRAAAVLAAARLEPTRFWSEAEILGREKSPPVLAALADALTGVPGAEARAKLVALAGNADAGVRLAAVTALSLRSEPEARAAAAAALVDADERVRLIAIGVTDDLAVLASASTDEAPETRRAALARSISLRGRLATLSELATRMADAAPGSAERARLAQAWLAAHRPLR